MLNRYPPLLLTLVAPIVAFTLHLEWRDAFKPTIAHGYMTAAACFTLLAVFLVVLAILCERMAEKSVGIYGPFVIAAPCATLLLETALDLIYVARGSSTGWAAFVIVIGAGLTTLAVGSLIRALRRGSVVLTF